MLGTRKTTPLDASPLSVTPETGARLLRPARSPRVLVVGDVMLDRYVSGAVDRISPEAPVPVVQVEDESRAPGGAANVAAGVVALGGECRLVGVRGEDGAGEALAAELRGRGVGAEGLVTAPGRPTTVKTRVLARHQQMLRVDRERTEPVDEARRTSVLGAVRERLAWADVVAVVDYDKGVLDEGAGARVVEAAREAGVPAVVDPKLRNFGGYPGAFLFKPNGRELAAALGEEAPPRSEEALEGVRERLSCRHLLMTLGADGMVLVDGDRGRARRIPSRAREVFDVSGAGDTVTAVLAAVLGAADDVAEAAAMANFAAGLAVSRLGAVPVGRDEILEALDDRDGGPSGAGGDGRPDRRAPNRTEGADDAPEGRREPAGPGDRTEEERS